MVMPGDKRRSQQVKVTIEYAGELAEDLVPEPGRAGAVIGPERFAKVKRWHVNRVFYFLTGSSAMCLGTVALVPRPAVQGTAVAVWAGSAGLARFLLAGSYRNSTKDRTPAE